MLHEAKNFFNLASSNPETGFCTNRVEVYIKLPISK